MHVMNVHNRVFVLDVTHVTNANCQTVGVRIGREMRHTGAMTEWLTVPDLVEILGQSPSRVRRLIDQRVLPATRRENILVVPAEFLVDGVPQPDLHGTAIVLADAGFRDDEIVNWLIEPDDSIGDAPIAALRAGRKSLVRRIAQAL